jgi:hypothetical protein
MTITEANKWPQAWQWVEIKDVVDIIVPTRIRIRYGRGQMRKLEIKPDRNISIVAPGGLKISGLRMQ